MKNLFLAASLLVAIPFAVVAQPSLSNNPQSSPRFRSNGAENSGFGVKGGINLATIQGDGVKKMYSGVNQLTQYHFGAYAQIGVSNRFSVQPELLYQRKGFKSKTEILANNTADQSDDVKLSYLSVPVLLVFNIFDKLAIQVGPQVSYLLNAHVGSKTIDTDTYNYNPVDVGVVGGLETKFEFLRVGVRYDYSLSNLREAGEFTAKDITHKAQTDIRNGVLQAYIGIGL